MEQLYSASEAARIVGMPRKWIQVMHVGGWLKSAARVGRGRSKGCRYSPSQLFAAGLAASLWRKRRYQEAQAVAAAISAMTPAELDNAIAGGLHVLLIVGGKAMLGRTVEAEQQAEPVLTVCLLRDHWQRFQKYLNAYQRTIVPLN